MLDVTAGKELASRLWVWAHDRHVVFDFIHTKHGSGPAAYLRDFSGIVLGDAAFAARGGDACREDARAPNGEARRLADLT